MASESFTAAARSRGDVAVIDLAGDVGREADGPLDAAYDEAVASGASVVLLNFIDVDYINSTGIAVIVGLLARARADGRAVIAYGLSDHYREIFEITRLSDFMAISDDEENAVAQAAAS